MSRRSNVFQERHCCTWKTDVIDHKVREINFGTFNLLLELQPQICQSVVYMFLYDKGKSGVKFDTRTYVKDKDGKEIFVQLFKGSLQNGPTVWSLERDEVLSNGDNSQGDGIITFDVEISPYEETNVLHNKTAPTEKETGNSEQKNSSCLQMMSLDFGKLYDNEEGSDVLLKCADRHIKAHRCILSARSDVFAAMFRSDMLESQEGVVDIFAAIFRSDMLESQERVVTIKDVAPETLERMLQYIYCGGVEELTVEASSELYKAADQYGIGSLKDLCVSFLTENLSLSSACDVLLLADTYNDEMLENCAIAFMAEHCAALSLHTDQWNKFCEEHPSIGIKVYQKYACGQSEAASLQNVANSQVSTRKWECENEICYDLCQDIKSSHDEMCNWSEHVVIDSAKNALEAESIKPDEKNLPSLEKMSLDFGKLFDNEDCSDVVLKCLDRQFKAHSYILSVRSDVLAAMFRSDMENLRGVVTIEDVAPETLGLMLRYIYTGKVEELTVETASKLYKAAVQYVVGPLKNRCVSFLRENLSQISACDILLLADACSDEQLEKSATDFIVGNCAILRTDQWYKFCEEHPSLGNKVYRKYVWNQPQSRTGLIFNPY